MKHAILVVGTGRSGTSAMTGILKILGAYLGEDLLHGDALNPKGYFENTRLTDLNKKLLAAASMFWYGSSPDQVHAVPVTAASAASIRTQVSTIFGERSPIAFKDPRLCVLLDVYVSTLRDMHYDVHCVLMTRDPALVAKSIAAATSGPGSDGSRWVPMARRHAELLEAARNSTRVDFMDCTFDVLVEQTEAVIRTLAVRFPFLSCSAAQMREAVEFIDGSLKHH